MYQVFAFYPNIDLKVRITEYKKEKMKGEKNV